MSLEIASFGIMILGLLVAIATFAYTTGVSKPVRSIICTPSLLGESAKITMPGREEAEQSRQTIYLNLAGG